MESSLRPPGLPAVPVIVKSGASPADQKGMSLSFLTGYVLGQRDAASSALRAAAIPAAESAGTEDLLDLHERIDRLLLVVTAMAKDPASRFDSAAQLAAALPPA